jgi:hypothetical protein
VVDRALERDQAAASAEYLAQFRSDIDTFVNPEVVRACVGTYFERAPLEQYRYYAFVDPSGGSGTDSFTMAIAHKEGDKAVIDAVHERKPPFSPETVVDDFCVVLAPYRISRVTGDRYAGEWPREQFRKRNINYVCSEKVRSDLYRDLLPKLNSGQVVLPKSEKLVNQLCALERRTARSGKDSIDHGPGSHDDTANVAAGVVDLIVLADRQTVTGFGVGTYCIFADEEPTPLEVEMAALIKPDDADHSKKWRGPEQRVEDFRQSWLGGADGDQIVGDLRSLRGETGDPAVHRIVNNLIKEILNVE